MDDIQYYIWLSQLFHYGSNKPEQILSLCSSPKIFYEMSRNEKKNLNLLTEKELDMTELAGMKRAEWIMKSCEQKKIQLISYHDALYPSQLKAIYAPPILLYAMGDIKGLEEELLITIVGTRNATLYSSFLTEYLSYHLARTGAVIVSGCALGIDTAAHLGALKARGRTLSVLACGLDVDYPKGNRKLKEKLLERGGALLSELPPGAETSARIFPIRNRILAGLSQGVLVTHAPERSGALITAEHALEQGKEVFCVPPYSIFDAGFSGVIRYLRDGATPVFSPSDILNPFLTDYAHRLRVEYLTEDYVTARIEKQHFDNIHKVSPKIPEKKAKEKEGTANTSSEKKINPSYSEFDANQLLVYNKLGLSPKLADELAVECKLSIGVLFSVLTELELMGAVEMVGGNQYIRK